MEKQVPVHTSTPVPAAPKAVRDPYPFSRVGVPGAAYSGGLDSGLLSSSR
jgi:hypothetical protein